MSCVKRCRVHTCVADRHRLTIPDVVMYVEKAQLYACQGGEGCRKGVCVLCGDC